MDQIGTAREAEQNAASFMRGLGFRDAAVTANGADGGIDVSSLDAIAQVKNWFKPVGRPPLQQLFGARGNRSNQKMLFFARSGYAATARTYADSHAIALFIFDHAGSITAINDSAQSMKNTSSGYSLAEDVATAARYAQATRDYNSKESIAARAAQAKRRACEVQAEREELQALEAHRTAVHSAIELLQQLGFGTRLDTYRTDSLDEDAEVRSVSAVARVRTGGHRVTKEVLANLHDVPGAHKKKMFFFSDSTYTDTALSYADEAGIALFHGGNPANKVAREHLATRNTSPTRPVSSLYQNPFFLKRQK